MHDHVVCLLLQEQNLPNCFAPQHVEKWNRICPRTADDRKLNQWSRSAEKVCRQNLKSLLQHAYLSKLAPDGNLA
jgi:hypothetical protein